MTNTPIPLFAHLVSLAPSRTDAYATQDAGAQERMVQFAGISTACSLDADTHDAANNERPAFLMPRAYWIPLAAWAGIVVLAMMGYFVQLLNVNVARGESLRNTWAATPTLASTDALAKQYESVLHGQAWEDMVSPGTSDGNGGGLMNTSMDTSTQVSMR